MHPSILTIYCERGIETGLLAEPVNALTNLLFLLFGFFGYRYFKQSGITDRGILSLPFIFASIGIGSLLFHTWRSTTTVIFDAIPIYVFILLALFFLLKKLVGSVRAGIILFIFIFIEVGLTAYLPQDIFNGSIRHIVAWIFISIVAYVAQRRFGTGVRRGLTMLLMFYALGILFRSIDMMFCQVFSLGTHFLWHTFTALAGYEAMRVLGIITASNDYYSKTSKK